jgi:CubicO group peptidase (beta-lactamase class C family)
VLIASFALFSHSACVTAKPRADAVDEYARAQLVERRIPGMAVAVIQHGKIQKVGSYGQASLEFDQPVGSSTRFSVASISKCFTSVAIMTFVQTGKLRLDDSIASHLQGLPASWRPVTVRQLLNHTSGLPDIQKDDYTTNTIAADPVAAIRILEPRPLEFPPGTKWRYNQTNYMLLGMLVEALAGQPYEQYLAERLFKPLKLRDVTFGDARTIVEGRATTYTKFRFGDGPPVALSHAEVLNAEMPPMSYPAGGLHISIDDFAQWLSALLNGRIIDKDSLDLLWTPTRLGDGAIFQRAPTPTLWRSYGLGWVLETEGLHPFAGGTGGLRAAFFVYPKDELAVVVLTNWQGSNPESMVNDIAQLYLPSSQ